MRTFIVAVLAVLFVAPAARAALPGDSAAGQRLHTAHCAGCHDTGVYTRKARTVNSLDGLKQQLQGCSHAAQKEFSAVETQNLLRFLNDRYYHFP